jgi:hypothetical protein
VPSLEENNIRYNRPNNDYCPTRLFNDAGAKKKTFL